MHCVNIITKNHQKVYFHLPITSTTYTFTYYQLKPLLPTLRSVFHHQRIRDSTAEKRQVSDFWTLYSLHQHFPISLSSHCPQPTGRKCCYSSNDGDWCRAKSISTHLLDQRHKTALSLYHYWSQPCGDWSQVYPD